MLNREFLKRISILYVEDEPMIRDSMQLIFDKLFKHTVIATNGQDGLDRFKFHQERGMLFDVIISDINMPIMNGIEMIEQIRKLDENIPIILTTAYSDSKYFLDAIALKVHHYAIKPLEIKALAHTIQDATMKYFDRKIIENKQKENERYLDIINQTTLVSRTDLSGNISFANELFSIVSGYTNSELVGANQRIVRHTDMHTIFFDDLWNTLRAKLVWKGKIKNKAKDGTAYFVQATIFPLFDEYGEKVIEYMAVQYLVTEEELEKRDFKKKVIQNIKDSKLTQIELKQEIDHLRTRLKSQYANDDINIAMETLYSEKRKNSRLLTQIDHYEALIANKVTQEEEMMEKHTKQLELLRDQKSQYETNSKALLEENEKLTINLDALKKQTIQDQIYIKDGEKKILFLQDVIKHREEEILVLKEKLKRFEK